MATTLANIFQGVSEEHGTLVTGTTTGTGAAAGATLVDSSLADYPDNYFNEYHSLITSGTSDGDIRLVSDFAQSTGTVTPTRAYSAQIATSVTHELHFFNPNKIKEKINDAIKRTKYLFRVIEDLNRVTRENVYAYDVSSSIIKDPLQIFIERDWPAVRTIHDCDTVWAESVDGDVTASLDNLDYQCGSGSMKMVVAAGASANDILATFSIDALDLSDDIGVQLAIKSSVAKASGDLQLLLDEDASCASPSETLDIPALEAGKWEFVRIAYAGATTARNAIISGGIKYVTDDGAGTVWVDNIESISTEPAGDLTNMPVWEPLLNWEYDDTNHKVRFGYNLPANRRLKMIGKGFLTALATEAGTTEADEPDISHLYHLALSYLYREMESQSIGADKEEAAKNRKIWEKEAGDSGKGITAVYPPKTRKIPGWRYYGKGTG